MLAEMPKGNPFLQYDPTVNVLRHDKSNFAKIVSSSGKSKDIWTYFCGNLRPFHGWIDFTVPAPLVR